MTSASVASHPKIRNERPVRIQQQMRAPQAHIAGLAAAVIAFISAWEPNAALRYGPFIAVGAFLLSRPLRFRVGVTEWAIVLFVVWVALSQFWTEHPAAFASQLIAFSSLAVMFVGVRAASRWGQNEAIAVGGYVAGCIYGLALTSFQLITGAGPVYYDSFGRVTQVGSLNVNYVAYTTVAAIVLVLLALQSGQIRGRRMRMIAIATLVVLALGGLSTQTKGAQISMLLLGAWLLVSRFGRPVKVFTTVCVVAVVSVSFGWIDQLLKALDTGDRSIAGLSGRLPLWESARSTWAESILTGAGLGADRAQNVNNLPTHNTFLGLGITLGIVGLALFLTFAISSLNDRLRDLSAPDRRFRILTIIVALTPILLTSSWEGTASGWVGLALLSTPILAAAHNAAGTIEGREGLALSDPKSASKTLMG